MSSPQYACVRLSTGVISRPYKFTRVMHARKFSYKVPVQTKGLLWKVFCIVEIHEKYKHREISLQFFCMPKTLLTFIKQYNAHFLLYKCFKNTSNHFFALFQSITFCRKSNCDRVRRDRERLVSAEPKSNNSYILQIVTSTNDSYLNLKISQEIVFSIHASINS